MRDVKELRSVDEIQMHNYDCVWGVDGWSLFMHVCTRRSTV